MPSTSCLEASEPRNPVSPRRKSDREPANVTLVILYAADEDVLRFSKGTYSSLLYNPWRGATSEFGPKSGSKSGKLAVLDRSSRREWGCSLALDHLCDGLIYAILPIAHRIEFWQTDS